MISYHVTVTYDTYDVILSHTPFCVVSPKEKEKEKKRNINNDLAILPSHDKYSPEREENSKFSLSVFPL